MSDMLGVVLADDMESAGGAVGIADFFGSLLFDDGLPSMMAGSLDMGGVLVPVAGFVSRRLDRRLRGGD